MLRFDAIGTPWSIRSSRPLGPVRDHLDAVIEDFDAAFSRFRTDSLVSALARHGGTVRFPKGSAEIFALVDALHHATGGAFDPTVAAALEHLGYDAHYRLTPLPGPAPTAHTWSALHRDGDALTADAPVLIDIGALGKGRLVDDLARVLEQAGHGDYVIDAGGDIIAAGDSQPRVGLEAPREPGRILGVLPLQDAALCASGTSRRAWGDGLHHILDARTGEPTAEIIATWVRAPTAMLADALATALFFASPAELRQLFAFDFARIRADGHAEASGPFIPALTETRNP